MVGGLMRCCVCKSERVREKREGESIVWYVAVVVAMSKIEWFLEWVRRR